MRAELVMIGTELLLENGGYNAAYLAQELANRD